jgi:hypothetical protein
LPQEQELLSKEKDSKRRLEDANRVIREQASQSSHQQQQPSSVGPSRKMAASPMEEPSAKRPRVDTASIPPHTPIPIPAGATVTRAVAPPSAATALGGPGESQKTGEFIADALLPQSTTEAESGENMLLSEAEFIATLSKPEITLQIRIPNDPSQMAWNFYGQILPMTVNVMTKVKTVKEELSRLHLNGMPANKIQFKYPNTGFLKDSMTLAALNIGPTATVDLIPKTRGGRK